MGGLTAQVCRAKLNLFLEVTGRRADGYHDLDTVFHTVDLADALLVEVDPAGAPGAIVFDVGGVDGAPVADDVPRDASNLVVRALRVARDAAGTDTALRARLVKRIPSGAGLGGGSADAAGALRAVAALRPGRLDDAALHGLAASLGSDVPFLVRGGAARATGRGEVLTGVTPAKDIDALVMMPALRLATPDVYRALTPSDFGRRDPAAVLDALVAGDADGVLAHAHNALAAAAFRIAPELDALRRRLAARLRRPVLLTGSGAALFTLLRAGDPCDVPVDEPGLASVWRTPLSA